MRNDDILLEVLCRLPIKSLIRFKCVSKQWNSIIRNPVFAQAYSSHGRGYRGLLLSRFNVDSDTGYYTCTFYSIKNNNRHVCCQISLKLDDFIGNDFDDHVDDYLDHTRIVKGMIGFYCPNKPTKLTLCNIATHQMLDILILAPCGMNIFFVGFDPANQVYKIFRCYADIGNIDVCYTEICTIGGGENNLSWRSLERPHDISRPFECKCINGIMYFLCGWLPNLKSLIAFDLKTETFKSIPVPESTNSFVMSQSTSMKLVEIGGRPALLYLCFSGPFSRPGGPTDYMRIWMLRNNEDTWTEPQRVDIMGMGGFFSYVDTLPTGDMLLAEKGCWITDEVASLVRIYKYDHLEKKLENWVNIPNDLGESHHMEIHYHEDNIIRLGAS